MDNIKITIETNANEAAKTFENLANSFNDADTQAQDLRKEIKSLKNEIYKLEPGTKEYTQTLVKLGEKMNTLGDINRDLRSSTGGLDTVFQTTTKTISSMAAGMQACMGVVALFGGDTEDLQKQFVKLQAAMSIVQGLSGFSGLTKAAGDAASSIRAFIVRITLSTAATEADTAAKTKNTVATEANTAALLENAGAAGTAGTAMSGLGTAGQGLRAIVAKLVPGLIGLTAVLAAIILPIRSIIKDKERLNELEESYNNIMSRNIQLNVETTDTYKAMKQELDAYIEKLREEGATEEEIRQVKDDFWKLKQKEVETDAQHIKNIKDEITWYNSSIVLIKNKKTSIKGLNKEEKELEQTMGLINKSIRENKALGNPFEIYENHLKETMRNMKLLIAEGLADAEDEYEQLVIVSKKYIGEIYERARKEHRGLTTNEKDNVKKAQDNIDEYNYQIKLIHAAARKQMREETQKTMTEYQKNFDSLSKAISTALSEVSRDLEKEFNRIAGTDVEGKSVISNLFLKFRELMIKGVDPKLIEQYKQDIEDAFTNNEIKEAQRDALKKMVDDLEKQYNDILQTIMTKLSPDLKFDMGGQMLNTDKLMEIMSQANDVIDLEITYVSDFRKRMADLKTAFDNGEIDPGQYAEAIHRNISEYYKTISQAMSEIPKYVNQLMQGDAFSGMSLEQKDAWKKVLTKYLEQAFYIPDSELTSLTENASKEIFKQLDTVFKDLENQMAAAQQAAEQRFYASSNNIMNKGGEGFQGFMNKLIGGEFWGTGEGQSYQLAKQQTEDMWNAYKETADKEIAEIDRLMASAGEDMTLREELNNRKLDLQAKYNLAMEQYYNDLENLEHEHLAGIVSNINSVVNATGSLGSALSDYYSEMANDERLSEKEQREYTLKSLKMKKAMAYVSIAQGIVSAIAGAMELGFPMGPIVAALESASVAVAGAVQIKQINKQIRELNGSAGSDTPDAAGMVDRIITANAQNTDQTAQLNAEYTGGAVGEQKVYVTQSDISDAQDLNRTAVTQNGF